MDLARRLVHRTCKLSNKYIGINWWP